MSTKQNIKERDEARARLREILKPGYTVYTVLRHVSASGMSQVLYPEADRPDYVLTQEWL